MRETPEAGKLSDLQPAFFAELEALHAKPWLASSAREVVEVIRAILEPLECKNIVLAGLPQAVRLLAESSLKGYAHKHVEDLSRKEAVSFIAKADVGITWSEYAAAGQGTLLEVAYDDAARLASSLPQTHIALVSSSRLVPDISVAMDLAGRTVAESKSGRPTISMISGPSKTGDIEMRLLYGVHGPNSLNVVLLSWI